MRYVLPIIILLIMWTRSIIIGSQLAPENFEILDAHNYYNTIGLCTELNIGAYNIHFHCL